MRRSFVIGFLNSQRAEARMKLEQNPSVTCPRLLASSTRAVSMYWRYVAWLTCPITSMSRNWTGNSMLNFTCRAYNYKTRSAAQISRKLKRDLEKHLETPLKFRETG